MTFWFENEEERLPRIVAPVDGENTEGGCWCPKKVARGVGWLRFIVQLVKERFTSTNS